MGYCEKCGRKMAAAARFCPGCGRVVVKAEKSEGEEEAGIARRAQTLGILSVVAMPLLSIPAIICALISAKKTGWEMCASAKTGLRWGIAGLVLCIGIIIYFYN